MKWRKEKPSAVFVWHMLLLLFKPCCQLFCCEMWSADIVGFAWKHPTVIHCTALHCTKLHYISLHWTKLQCIHKTPYCAALNIQTNLSLLLPLLKERPPHDLNSLKRNLKHSLYPSEIVSFFLEGLGQWVWPRELWNTGQQLNFG